MISKIIFTTFIAIIFSSSIDASTKIMTLGDSITYDDSYSDHPELGGSGPRPASQRHAYRNYLWYKLQDAHYDVNFVGSRNAGSEINPPFDPDNEGYPGETSTYLAHNIYRFLQENPADIILIHIGTNDHSTKVFGVDKLLNEIDRYESDFHLPIKVILAKIIQRRSTDTIIKDFNKNIQNLANSRKNNGDDIYLVDMVKDTGLTSSDYQDRTHPNNDGYEKMATVWFNALIEILPGPPPPNPLLRPFVERFYQEVLLRQGEESGIVYWVEKLGYKSLAAADIARGFIESDEFKNKNTDNEAYLTILYHAFFDREPDDAGMQYWKTKLSDNVSRFNVLNGFLYSVEFGVLTKSYNILTIDPAELFVTRFYTKTLGRDAEKEGLIYWTKQLRTYNTTAKGIAKSFFFSDEFIAKDTTDEVYVTCLYETLLNREPDTAGLESWLERLSLGTTREEILDSFVHSKEFNVLAENYSIRL